MMKAVRDEPCVPRKKHEFGRKAVIFVLAVLALSAAQLAQAASLTIDFENEPSLPTQPDNFAMAGAMKTYSKSGVYSISGGVVLGNPTFLPTSPANGSPPNLYGTTDVADPSLLSSITLTLPAADNAIAVTLTLFNGQPVPEMYEVDAVSAVMVDKRFIATAESFNDGFAFYSVFFGIDLGPITSVVIMKSHLASVAFPAWCLGHEPSAQILCVSYAQDLADKLSRDCRRLLASDWYQRLFPTRLAPRHQAVPEFETTAQGSRVATSVGGVLTGRGADLIVIDDPLKPEEALSQTQRQAANEWYDHTLYSRLNDKLTGAIVLIMHRLHESLPSGVTRGTTSRF